MKTDCIFRGRTDRRHGEEWKCQRMRGKGEWKLKKSTENGTCITWPIDERKENWWEKGVNFSHFIVNPSVQPFLGREKISVEPYIEMDIGKDSGVPLHCLFFCVQKMYQQTHTKRIWSRSQMLLFRLQKLRTWREVIGQVCSIFHMIFSQRSKFLSSGTNVWLRRHWIVICCEKFQLKNFYIE